jgi:hypothetical protein
VWWRGRTKTIRLRATRTRRRLIRLRGFTGTGRLVVRVTGHGRTVIDGLGVWKRKPPKMSASKLRILGRHAAEQPTH